MIFISYNHKDQQLVDMVARRLELEFGRNNIFYDKWSIQPGDSIIGKMNEGLNNFTTFFYFLSPNSLKSKMVSKEWQTALNKAINENLKFVPIRIADCNPPSILTDTLYIDLFGVGIDDAIAQMKNVVKGENNYQALDDISNLKAVVQIISSDSIKIEIKATLFSENDANFAYIFDNEIEDFDIVPLSDSMSYNSTGEIMGQKDGIIKKFHMKTVQLFRPITPTNSMKVSVKGKKPLRFVGVMKVLSNTKGKHIDFEYGQVL